MLEQFINNIKNKSTANIKLDVDFFDVNISYHQIHKSLDKNEYIYYKLGDILTELLSKNYIKLPQNSSIIQIPKIPGPDFVISIKNIYDFSDKSKSLSELSKYIYQILGSQNIYLVSKIELNGIYINIYTNNSYKTQVLEQISNLGKSYGNIYLHNYSNKNIIVEYPSCNTAKSMGVHHVRSMIIGQVWSNILSHTGASICGRNYLGDRGTPFGKLIYSIEYFGKIDTQIYKKIENKPNEMLGQIYADFKLIPLEEKDDIARSYFARIESGDTDMLQLRKFIRNLSLIDFQNLFDKFGVKPDTDIGESYSQIYEAKVILDLQNAKLLHESQGALITKFVRVDGELVPLFVGENEPEEKSSMEFFIIKKSDGSTNYATRDLGLMKLRGEKSVDKIYIPTDNGQKLHFQLIKILATKLGYISADAFVHIPFGLLLSGGEKMSTRNGKVFRLEDLISEIINKLKIDFAERINDEVAAKLAVSAIIFNDIKGDINKDINFDINMMTKSSGDSGIYLQYTKSRINSIINKLPPQNDFDIDILPSIFSQDDLISAILVKLSYISYIYSDSIVLIKPHIIVQYILSICGDLNSRYNNGPKVLDLHLDMQVGYRYILGNIYICLENLFATIHLPQIDKV